MASRCSSLVATFKTRYQNPTVPMITRAMDTPVASQKPYPTLCQVTIVPKQRTPMRKQIAKNDASPRDPMIHQPVILPPFFFPHSRSLGFIESQCIRSRWFAKPHNLQERQTSRVPMGLQEFTLQPHCVSYICSLYSLVRHSVHFNASFPTAARIRQCSS